MSLRQVVEFRKDLEFYRSYLQIKGPCLFEVFLLFDNNFITTDVLYFNKTWIIKGIAGFPYSHWLGKTSGFSRFLN